MALPFVLGLALGAGAVIAYNKSDKIKSKADELFEESKNLLNNSLEKSKELACDAKDTVSATADCIKEKKKSLQEESSTKTNAKDEEV